MVTVTTIKAKAL